MLQYRRHGLQNITSDVGIKLRINRSIQVEGAFGVIKENYAFRRFLTRGKRKTETQFFLIAFAFNILKFRKNHFKNKKSKGLSQFFLQFATAPTFSDV